MRLVPARRAWARFLLAAWLAAALAGAWARPAAARPPAQSAEDRGRFTVLISSAYVRSAPDFASEAVFSVFQGQTFPVEAQTTNGQWLLIRAPDQAGWVREDYGALDGDLSLIPATVVAAPDPPGTVPFNPNAPIREVPEGVVPTISEAMQEVYRRGLAQGNNPYAFAKIGDCNTENGRFLSMFDEPGTYRLGERYAYLQHTINRFRGSFSRTSVAAHSGFSAAAVMDPTWANPQQCEPGESPVECEFRIMRPSFALINLGTHAEPTIDAYEAAMRRLIETTLSHNVIPILATKADDLEGQGRINEVVRRLAAEYEVPLWDFWKAVQPLPAQGLASDGIHFTYGRSVFDDPWAMSRGWTWRNLTALLALDAAVDGVVKPPTVSRTPYR